MSFLRTLLVSLLKYETKVSHAIKTEPTCKEQSYYTLDLGKMINLQNQVPKLFLLLLLSVICPQ